METFFFPFIDRLVCTIESNQRYRCID